MQLELFAPTVTCAYTECQRETDTPKWVTKHIGRSTIQLPFCGEVCAQAYYLKRLREAGQ